MGADERATEIQQEVLGRKDRATSVVTQFLALNAEDNDYFRQITLATPTIGRLPSAPIPSRRLQEAFDFLGLGFRGLSRRARGREWPAPLIRWDKYLMEQTKIIEVSVPDESRGYAIFETLNDRGLSLSTSDLLKNHLLGTAGRQDEGSGRIRGPERRQFSTHRTRTWTWKHAAALQASRKGVVRDRQPLFWQMKGEIPSAKSAVGLASDLENASRYWTAMLIETPTSGGATARDRYLPWTP